ncbi:DUF1349 domain-containing protein [Chitinophaga sp. Hz27]|uniref:DUF1349 domain-containing protein n=1 Tax=Chitinophaga sp. Hz27 TaxID=3347169 RepID=UPI0035DCD5B2
MKSVYAFTLLFFFAAFGAKAANLSDSVRIPGMPGQGSWINQPAKITVKGNNLNLFAPKETDFYHAPNGGFKATSASILLFQPDSNFTITTRTKVAFGKTYDGGAIFVYADTTHYIKFLFEFSHYGKYSICSGATNGVTDDCNNAVAVKNEVYLRLSKNGPVYGLFYSLDGKEWFCARMVRFNPGGNIRVGFSSQAPLSQTCETTFSDIQYAPVGFKNGNTGDIK